MLVFNRHFLASNDQSFETLERPKWSREATFRKVVWRKVNGKQEVELDAVGKSTVAENLGKNEKSIRRKDFIRASAGAIRTNSDGSACFLPGAGVKKPPLAPKPKLPSTTKPSPPPIAPKPGLLTQSSVVTQPSPATLKRTKPAVAPKPCIPKSAASSPPVSPPPPKPRESLILSQEQQEALDDSLSLLNSKNGILSESSKRESDYIIPTCSCGLQDCSQCRRLENGRVTEIGSDLHKEHLQNGISTEGFTGTKPREKAESREEQGVAVEKGEEAERTEEQRGKTAEAVKHQESAEPDVSKVDERAEDQNTHSTDSKPACDVAGSIIVLSSIPPHNPPVAVESSEPVSKASPSRSHPDLQVPAAPSKPLPVPHPRKHKKPALVRQDGVEAAAQEQMREAEARLSLAALSVSSEGEELKQDTIDDLLSQRDSDVGVDEPDAPVPLHDRPHSRLASTGQCAHLPHPH
ncbi:hypothetical protein INR49_004961 [Caranx melampygus]|nr:hypothetical protein INR49_004961 [Caranx melampygus]